MKLIAYNLFIFGVSILIHYGGFIEDIFLCRVLAYINIILASLGLLSKSIRRDISTSYSNMNFTQWAIGSTAVATNLYLSRGYLEYFYAYTISNLIAYAVIFSNMTFSKKSENVGAK